MPTATVPFTVPLAMAAAWPSLDISENFGPSSSSSSSAAARISADLRAALASLVSRLMWSSRPPFVDRSRSSSSFFSSLSFISSNLATASSRSSFSACSIAAKYSASDEPCASSSSCLSRTFSLASSLAASVRRSMKSSLSPLVSNFRFSSCFFRSLSFMSLNLAKDFLNSSFSIFSAAASSAASIAARSAFFRG